MKTDLKRTILFEDRHMRVEWLPSDAERIVLCFTGIGHSLGGIDVQRPEFSGTGLRVGAPVFVIDKTRSWGNALDFGRIRSLVDTVSNGRPLISLGNSMGGFLAIAATRHLPILDALSFAPQFSVDPGVLPDEIRWMDYRARITEFRIPSLADAFGPGCRYHIFVGDDPQERRHWERFPQAANIRCYLLRGEAHDVALSMKKADLLESAVLQSLGPGISPEKIAAAHGLVLLPGAGQSVARSG